jgi:hypothetical protein
VAGGTLSSEAEKKDARLRSYPLPSGLIREVRRQTGTPLSSMTKVKPKACLLTLTESKESWRWSDRQAQDSLFPMCIVAVIICSMTLELTGLEIKSSMPAAKQRSRSSLIADAVMATMGT